MSDNTQLNQNSTSGDIISTDQLVDLSKVQNVKTAFGFKDQMIQVNNAADKLPVNSAGDYTKQILAELRVQSILMAQAFGIRDNLDDIRKNEINSIP